jgi:hypothetical protein
MVGTYLKQSTFVTSIIRACTPTHLPFLSHKICEMDTDIKQSHFRYTENIGNIYLELRRGDCKFDAVYDGD